MARKMNPAPTSRRELFAGSAALAAAGMLGAVPQRATAATATALAPSDNERFLARLLGEEKLFWIPDVQKIGYKSLERILATRPARKAATPGPFARNELQTLAYRDQDEDETLDDFLRLEHIAGLLVLKDGAIRLERYALDLAPHEHWTSMSMVKSVTATLVGCALHDKLIPNLDVTAGHYVGELRQSAYADVTLRQLLWMASGIDWDENYVNPVSDVNLHYEKVIAWREAGGILAHLKTLPRAAAPGTRFHYNTGDTFVIGCMLTAALGGTLASYLERRIWSRIGTEQDLLFLLESDDGQEVGGSSASATLRDYARFGQFILEDGVIGGERVFPEGWMAEATTPSPASLASSNAGGAGGAGYGYQWWLQQDGGYSALGHAGQVIRIQPKERTVVVLLSALPAPYLRDKAEISPTRRQAFMTAIDRALA